MKLGGKLAVCNSSALFATYLKTKQVLVDCFLKDISSHTILYLVFFVRCEKLISQHLLYAQSLTSQPQELDSPSDSSWVSWWPPSLVPVSLSHLVVDDGPLYADLYMGHITPIVLIM